MTDKLIRLSKPELVDMARDTGWDGDPAAVTKPELVGIITAVPVVTANPVAIVESDPTPRPELPPRVEIPDVSHTHTTRERRLLGPSRTR